MVICESAIEAREIITQNLFDNSVISDVRSTRSTRSEQTTPFGPPITRIGDLSKAQIV